MLRKFTKSDSFKVLSPAQHLAAALTLKRFGKTSAAQLTETEREELEKAIRRS